MSPIFGAKLGIVTLSGQTLALVDLDLPTYTVCWEAANISALPFSSSIFHEIVTACKCLQTLNGSANWEIAGEGSPAGRRDLSPPPPVHQICIHTCKLYLRSE